MSWEEKILTYLVENYRKSKKDSGDNKTNRRTQVKPEKLYTKYKANDGDYDVITAFNQTVRELSEKGFVTYENETFGTQILCIYLIDEQLPDVEQFLYEHYGYVSKEMHLKEVSKIITKYKNASFVCNKECERLKVVLNENKIPKDYQDLDAVLRAIAFIEQNQESLYIREASMKIYGDSKFFEEVTLIPVCKLLRKYMEKPCENDALLDEILADYQINKEPQKLCFKGNLILGIDGKELDLSGLSGGIEFMASELSRIDYVRVMAARFMTIENRTSYLRYQDENTVVFYLGGYANRFQRDFIKKVFEMNPNIEYLHFGDIDAGGFWIHHNLCEITGVDFSLFQMSVDELRNKEYESCLHGLTDNDKNRLRELQKIEQYADTVSYMMDHNVKLEQEIISLNLMLS